jgi:hypothetical protein
MLSIEQSRLPRSAHLWSAVSPTCSRQACEALGRQNSSCAQQAESLRYSRLQVCATHHSAARWARTLRRQSLAIWLILAVIWIGFTDALAAKSPSTAISLATRFFRLTITPSTGHCEILDPQTQAKFGSAQPDAPFGTITIRAEGKSMRLPLTRCDLTAAGQKTATVATFHPLPDKPNAAVRVRLEASHDQHTLQLTYDADPGLEIESISPLAYVLAATDSGEGYVVVPVREGLLIPADSGVKFDHRFDTYAYEGCHMEMIGLVQSGTAVLVTWDDPYVAVDVKSTIAEAGSQGNRQRIAASLALSKSASSFRIRFLGKGDYVTVAKAYRQIAKDKGLLVTWDQKLKQNPERAKLFGAANIKLWSTLDRRMNEDSTKEESMRVNWTFEEAAQVAEHLKQDLKLDLVLFTIGGWLHRGYDNQHPDILPTAPECGGDSAFADCARRVMEQGYLFCLHDNYQDIYRDSPSWNERFIMKTRDGKLARGGHWAGGMAFLTCSKMALELAERPQNLPAVKKLSNANAYFIDTTYAAGLQECFDPAHPLTRADDIKWKQALSDYARGVFGVFGSECGREWAIPHSDFFEGLTGVSGHSYHDAGLPEKLGATVVPLFDLVYRDCIAMYGKYGYDPKQAARYVLQHISLARPLNYHSIPRHLYWKKLELKQTETPQPTAQAAADLFTHAQNGWAAGLHVTDRFIKNTYEILSPLNELTARLQMTRHEFLTADRAVQRTVFGEGPQQVNVTVNFGASDYSCNSAAGKPVRLPAWGFLVESPGFVAFYARNWGGLEYDSAPPLFTLRSLDGRSLSKSRQVRVFHAFGDDRLQLGSSTVSVAREATLNPKAPSS